MKKKKKKKKKKEKKKKKKKKQEIRHKSTNQQSHSAIAAVGRAEQRGSGASQAAMPNRVLYLQCSRGGGKDNDRYGGIKKIYAHKKESRIAHKASGIYTTKEIIKRNRERESNSCRAISHPPLPPRLLIRFLPIHINHICPLLHQSPPDMLAEPSATLRNPFIPHTDSPSMRCSDLRPDQGDLLR